MSRLQPRRWGVCLTSAVAVTALAACGSGGSSSGGNDDVASIAKDFKVAIQLEPDSLDPCDSYKSANGPVLSDNITETLIHHDATTQELKPSLATSWEQTSPTTWQFHLRDGVTFQDGTAFDAKAVAWWINRVIDPKANCYALGSILTDNVTGATAKGDDVVEVTTKDPDPLLAAEIAFLDIGVPTADPLVKAKTPVGTGPYKFTSYSPGHDFVMTRWDDYWGEKPQIEKVTYKFRAEPSVRAAMASSKEVHIATSIASQDAKTDGAVNYTTVETVYYRIGLGSAPLDDLRIRKAINYAIDREGLIETAWNGLGAPANEIFLDTFVGYDPSVEWTYDPDKAKQLIAEAKADGVPVDKQITIIGETSIGTNGTEVDDAVAAMLKEVGLNVVVRDVPDTLPVISQAKNLNAPPQLIQNTHGNSTGDAYASLSSKVSCSGPQSLLCDSTFDNMLKAAGVASGDERKEKLQAADKYLFENAAPLVPLVHLQNTIVITNSHVHYTPDAYTTEHMPIASMTVK